MPDDAGQEALEVITAAVAFAAVQAGLVADLSDRTEHEYVASLRKGALVRQAARERLDMLAAHDAAHTCYECGRSTRNCYSGWICDACRAGEGGRDT